MSFQQVYPSLPVNVERTSIAPKTPFKHPNVASTQPSQQSKSMIFQRSSDTTVTTEPLVSSFKDRLSLTPFKPSTLSSSTASSSALNTLQQSEEEAYLHLCHQQGLFLLNQSIAHTVSPLTSLTIYLHVNHTSCSYIKHVCILYIQVTGLWAQDRVEYEARGLSALDVFFAKVTLIAIYVHIVLYALCI